MGERLQGQEEQEVDNAVQQDIDRLVSESIRQSQGFLSSDDFREWYDTVDSAIRHVFPVQEYVVQGELREFHAPRESWYGLVNMLSVRTPIQNLAENIIMACGQDTGVPKEFYSAYARYAFFKKADDKVFPHLDVVQRKTVLEYLNELAEAQLHPPIKVSPEAQGRFSIVYEKYPVEISSHFSTFEDRFKSLLEAKRRNGKISEEAFIELVNGNVLAFTLPRSPDPMKKSQNDQSDLDYAISQYDNEEFESKARADTEALLSSSTSDLETS
ncbi:MAG: hypothetical protein Q7R48_03850 [bacterium]|nr:hypothetical protein [bacterium]